MEWTVWFYRLTSVVARQKLRSMPAWKYCFFWRPVVFFLWRHKIEWSVEWNGGCKMTHNTESAIFDIRRPQLVHKLNQKRRLDVRPKVFETPYMQVVWKKWQ